MEELQEQKVKLNEQEISRREFEKRKAELEKKPGVKVVETSQNTYKVRIQG